MWEIWSGAGREMAMLTIRNFPAVIPDLVRDPLLRESSKV